jgi:hypothetical protein
MVQTTSKDILEELKVIRRDLLYIKKHMVDVDTILTHEEEKILEDSLEEYKKGKTTSLKDFEKELCK